MLCSAFSRNSKLSSAKPIARSSIAQSLSSFPHKRVKDAQHIEAHAFIQVHRRKISLSNRKRKRAATVFLQAFARQVDQRVPQAAPALLGQNAHLGNVTHITFHPRTQNHAQSCARSFAARYQR